MTAAPALFAALALLAAPGPPTGTLSTMDLLAAKDEWHDWRESGETFSVEGRVRSVAGGVLRLRGLPLAVRPAPGTSLGRVDDRTARVEVTGRLDRSPAGTYLRSVNVRVLPRDDSTFTEKKARLDKSDPAAWDELAVWGERRAEFYDDPPLARRAAAARREAFDLRWKSAGDADSLPDAAPAGVPAAACGRS